MSLGHTVEEFQERGYRRGCRTGRRRRDILIILLLIASPLNVMAFEPPSIHGEADNIVTAFLESKVFEDRGRVLLKTTWSPAEWLFIKASGYGEVLTRSRVEDGSATNFRAHETYLELRGGFVEVRVGYSNVVWGVLDEVQPNDVINPLDISWFFFEDRSKARLPIPLVRTRLYLPSGFEFEFVAVPFFEKGVFDQLDEETSPFNLAAQYYPAGYPMREDLTEETFREMELGGRLSRTIRQVDIDLYAYRGSEDFPIYTVSAPSDLTFPFVLEAVTSYPEFTMFGADIETVIGKWGLRWEGAWFTKDAFQHPIGYEIVEGRSYQVGIGIDRTFYDDQVINASAVYQRRMADGDFIESPEELSLVVGLERSFRHDLVKVRLFTVYNPIDRTIFLRWSGKKNLVRNFWIEISSGVFLGDGNDLIGRFEAADFMFLRGKYYF